MNKIFPANVPKVFGEFFVMFHDLQAVGLLHTALASCEPRYLGPTNPVAILALSLY